MANTASNVVAGKPLATGGVLIAPTGTALPTDVTTALNAAFKAAGYVGEDGLTETIERSSESIRAWGGDTVKRVQTEFEVTYSLTFIESLNSEVLKTVFGDANVVTTAATASTGTLQAVKINSAELPEKEFVFEIRDGAAKVRVVIPRGKVTEVGETTYSDGEVIGYEVTITALPDASGNQAYKYSDDGKTSA